MLIVRRLHVTLLELLIVIAILVGISGAVMISINKAIIDQRFLSEVGMVLDTLRLAQDLMLILGADVKFIFQEAKGQNGKDKNGIEYWLEFDTLMSPNIKREVSKRVHTLKTVKGVFFVDEAFTEVQKGKIEINFFSKGSMMSKGVLRLATSDQENPPANALQRFICLAGYPKRITFKETLVGAEKECYTEDTEFNKKLTEDTWLKIPEKARKSNPKEEDNKDKDNKDKDK